MAQVAEKIQTKSFWNRLKELINEIDVSDDEGKSYEETSEFSSLSSSEQAELEAAQKSIKVDEVDYGKALKAEQKEAGLDKIKITKNKVEEKENKEEKPKAKKTKKVNDKDREKKIADYYSEEPKKTKKAKSKEQKERD